MSFAKDPRPPCRPADVREEVRRVETAASARPRGVSRAPLYRTCHIAPLDYRTCLLEHARAPSVRSSFAYPCSSAPRKGARYTWIDRMTTRGRARARQGGRCCIALQFKAISQNRAPVKPDISCLTSQMSALRSLVLVRGFWCVCFYHERKSIQNPNRTTGSPLCPLVRLGSVLTAI